MSSSSSEQKALEHAAIVEQAKRWGIAVVIPKEGWHPMITRDAGFNGTRSLVRKRMVTGAEFKNRADQSLRKFSWDG